MTKKGTIISKDKTQIIKGCAILFMIVHHCFIKEFYINPPSYLSTLICIKFYTSMKICVGLFTFFVEYGAFYTDFWINNAFVLFLIITTLSYFAALGINKAIPTLKKI